MNRRRVLAMAGALALATVLGVGANAVEKPSVVKAPGACCCGDTCGCGSACAGDCCGTADCCAKTCCCG